MREPVWSLATWLSAIALAMVIALTIRGCFVIDVFHHQEFAPQGQIVELRDQWYTNGPGWIIWSRETDQIANRWPGRAGFDYTEWRTDDPRISGVSALRPSFERRTHATGLSTGLLIPTWMIAIVPCAIVLAAAKRKLRRRTIEQRRLRGQCIMCGYDLRGGSERCPECGAEMSNVKGQSQTSKVKRGALQ